MATYAVGDIHGCHETLQRVLRGIDFDPAEDRLWLVGDLVNRGPRSLEVLRWAYEFGDRLTMVLGNHDIHLLAVAAGISAAKETPEITRILDAPDGEHLCEWLSSRPLLFREDPYVLVHAGLHPSWSIAESEALAREAEEALRTDRVQTLESIYGKASPKWDATLDGLPRLQFILKAFTRIRICTPDGAVLWGFTGGVADIPDGYTPWFRVPGRASAAAQVVFGHWAALGYHESPGAIAIDSGVGWGDRLTAKRLEDGAIFSVPRVER